MNFFFVFNDKVDVFTLSGIPSVGVIEKLRIWHDNTGPDPSWKLRSVSVQDRITGDVYLFDCYSLLSKDEGSILGDIKCAGKAEPKGEDYIICMKIICFNISLVTKVE